MIIGIFHCFEIWSVTQRPSASHEPAAVCTWFQNLSNNEDGQSAGPAVQPLSDVSQKNACLYLRDALFFFFPISLHILSDQRDAMGLLIPHTGGKPQSASLLNMAAAGYIYRHASAYGKAITAQSRAQSGAARAPSDCWQMCCGI